MAQFGEKGDTHATIQGVSHAYAPPGRATVNETDSNAPFTMQYMMHYVKKLVEPKTHYTYRVKSGAPGCQWSAQFSFRAPPTTA